MGPSLDSVKDFLSDLAMKPHSRVASRSKFYYSGYNKFHETSQNFSSFGHLLLCNINRFWVETTLKNGVKNIYVQAAACNGACTVWGFMFCWHKNFWTVSSPPTVPSEMSKMSIYILKESGRKIDSWDQENMTPKCF